MIRKCLGVLILSGAYASVCGATTFRTVALTGQPAPGGSGTGFGSFSNLALNNSGQLIVIGKLATGNAGVTTANDSGIWSERSGSLDLLAREGTQAPGAAIGANFYGDFSGVFVSDMGTTAFRGELTTGGGGVTAANDSGIWSDTAGSLALVAREGSPAPGAGPARFGSFFTPHVNGAGQVTFTGGLSLNFGVTESDNEGVWTVRDGALTLIAREGDAAPGANTDFGGGNLDLSNFSFSESDAAGRVVFASNIESGHSGVFSERSGALNLVVRAQTQAPGTPPGTSFFAFTGSPEVNSSGQIADQVILTGGDVTGTFENAIGIWSEGNGPLELIVRGGQQAAGVEPGVAYSFLSPPSFNDLERHAFFANLQGNVTSQNNEGFWSDASGPLALVAREGDQAPDVSAGAVFESFDRFAYRPQLNGAGQIAFAGKLRQGAGGVTADNDGAMWAQDLNGALRLVVREGDPFSVAPGDVRTISTIGPLNDARTFRFNDEGMMALILNFSDGSQGVFVAALAVPEPSAKMLILACCLVAIAFRRFPIAASP